MSRQTLTPLVACIAAASLLPLGCCDGPASAPKVIDKAIRAMGGEAQFARLNCVTWKSKTRVTGHDDTVVTTDEAWSARGVDQFHGDIVSTMKGSSLSWSLIVNGDRTWGRALDKTRETPAAKTAVLRAILRAFRIIHLLPQLRQKPYELTLVGDEKVGGQDTAVVRVAEPGQPTITLYFDKQSQLPIKTDVRVAEESGKEVLVEFFLSDYQNFDGLTHFTRLRVHKDGKACLESELSAVSAQYSLDDSLFEAAAR